MKQNNSSFAMKPVVIANFPFLYFIAKYCLFVVYYFSHCIDLIELEPCISWNDNNSVL